MVIIDRVQKQFPHIPKEALEIIIKWHLVRIRQRIGKKEILRPRKIFIKGLGTFIVGGKKEATKLKKLKRKILNKCVRKKRIRERANDLNWLL